jgi:hypothetical protein
LLVSPAVDKEEYNACDYGNGCKSTNDPTCDGSGVVGMRWRLIRGWDQDR